MYMPPGCDPPPKGTIVAVSGWVGKVEQDMQPSHRTPIFRALSI